MWCRQFTKKLKTAGDEILAQKVPSSYAIRPCSDNFTLYYALRLLDSFLLKKVACVQPRPDISTHDQELPHGYQMRGGIEQALSLAESSEVILDHIGGSSVPS